MSDLGDFRTTDSRYSSSIYGGITVDIAEGSLDRAAKLLAGIHGGLYKAVGSALSRAADQGKTIAKREVAKEYTLSQSEFLAQTQDINHFTRSGDGALSIEFGFRGHVIPLTKFHTRVSRSGGVVTQVKRGGGGRIEHGFLATMGSHTGIFERVGAARFPVREIFGPATTQMMYSNEDVLDQVADKMAEVYEKRLDHEIERLLNGWGR